MDEIGQATNQKFQKVLEVVRTDLATIRTGKAAPVLLENLSVEAYGSRMRLVELATIAAADPGTLMVTPFDPGNLDAIVTAIREANLGLTAIGEETKIRVIVPPISQERREEFVKMVKVKVEGGKVMLRQIRHEAMELAAKSGQDEDTRTRTEKEIQQLTDAVSAQLDEMEEVKTAELLTI